MSTIILYAYAASTTWLQSCGTAASSIDGYKTLDAFANETCIDPVNMLAMRLPCYGYHSRIGWRAIPEMAALLLVYKR
jgi:hypothetical protein